MGWISLCYSKRTLSLVQARRFSVGIVFFCLCPHGCEKSAAIPTPSTSCPGVVDDASSTCFWTTQDLGAIRDVEADCYAYLGYPASPSSSQDTIFLFNNRATLSIKNKDKIWLGVKPAVDKVDWTTWHGEPITWSSWEQGYPRQEGECVFAEADVSSYTLLWMNTDCSEHYKGLCYKKVEGLPPDPDSTNAPASTEYTTSITVTSTPTSTTSTSTRPSRSTFTRQSTSTSRPTTNTSRTKQTTTTPPACCCSYVTTTSRTTEQIIEELTLQKNTLSSSRRKRVSVTDNRPTATGIGYAGVAIMCVTFLPIILSDMLNFWRVIGF